MSAPTPLASVLVVTWNARAHLARCLAALEAQSLRDREVIVVDNGSTDDTAEMIRQTFPTVALVRSPTNLEFVGGNRLGLPRCRGRYVALLNNDCIAAPDWLERAVAAAEAADAAMIATWLLDDARPDRLDSSGIALDRAGIAWDRGGGAIAAATADPGWPPLFGPSGGAALYRRDLLADVGFFEPTFGMYYEDVDLAWRARLRGWQCVDAPAARVRHIGSASGGRNAPRKRFLLARNKLWTLVRCYPADAPRRYLAAALAYDAAALAAYVSVTSRASVSGAARLAAAQGRIAALRGLPAQLERRRAIQARATAPAGEVLARMAPIVQPGAVAARFTHLPERV